MRFMNKSGVANAVQAPNVIDDKICMAFDNVRMNQTADGIVSISDCAERKLPAGTTVANATSHSKASEMPTMNTDGAIVPKATQVQPKYVRKTPKFPSRERHMAIRRKKPPPPKALGAKCECIERSANAANGNDADVNAATE